MRCIISAAVVGTAAASLVHDCKSGLNQLQGQSDFELAASCRAAFAPAVCRGVSNSLGPQPWSNDRIEESCAKFATSFDGMDVRGLEQTLAAKHKTPLDKAAKLKALVPTSKPPQKKGLVGNLLDKLKEGQKRDEGKQGPLAKLFGKKEQDKPGPLAKLFGKKEQDKPGPLAKLFGDKGDKNKPGPLAKLFGKHDEKPAKPGPLAKLFGDKGDKNKPGPLAKLFGKHDEKPAEAKIPDLPTLLGKQSSRLYSASEVEPEPRSMMPAPMGVMMAAAASAAAALAVVFIVRRSPTDSASHPILDANGVEERCVE